MKLVVGLGNPGRKYQQTRHNVGFMVAEQLAIKIGASGVKTRFEGEYAEGSVGGEKIALLCPHTFMNASGRSVRQACQFYKLPTENLLVICDDLDLETGRLRLRSSGSAGGQKGLADIIRHLETEAFSRLKVGIGRPPVGWTVTDYVLGKFTSGEKKVIEPIIDQAANAAVTWATEGVTSAMNRFNTSTKQKPARKEVSTTDATHRNGSGNNSK